MKIVFTGPESSGKTTLANVFCNNYPFQLVKEFAREYMQVIGLDYGPQHVYEMGLLQHWEEETVRSKFEHICCDTDLQNILHWQKVKYGAFDHRLLEMWLASPGDHYFVCSPDIPWQHDPLRENPFDRDVLFDSHIDFLISFNMPYSVLDGSIDARLEKIARDLDSRGGVTLTDVT